jgi:hypothetical protein
MPSGIYLLVCLTTLLFLMPDILDCGLRQLLRKITVLPYTPFCNCLLITITLYTLLTSLFCSDTISVTHLDTPLKNGYHTFDIFAYEDFSKRGKLLIKKLMLQGYNESRLKSSFRKFYGRL